jgi:hypothetical protein
MSNAEALARFAGQRAPARLTRSSMSLRYRRPLEGADRYFFLRVFFFAVFFAAFIFRFFAMLLS